MCGFAGFCGRTDKAEETVEKMASLIRHRGPDSSDVYSDGCFSVGFSRLKIIDLEHGAQPMTDESGRYVICFNGEIYNHIELRARLISDFGVSFKTRSDTEVLLYACIFYGKGVFYQLRGMYSFAFYDREKKTLFCARDPFGIKPFYYGRFGESFIFSSEIKAFYAHPDFTPKFNSDILPLYLQFQYVPTEETAFVGVSRLLPGHCLEYEDGVMNIQKYFEMPLHSQGKFTSFSFWNAPVDAQKEESTLKRAKNSLETALCDSVDIHLRSDVPVGAFLSGGVDSALIASMVRPSCAFTVGFENTELDERRYAEENAKKLGIQLKEKVITPDDFFKTIPLVQYHSDEPCANLSAVPLYLLAELASSEYKVVLSGEGADELFGGYDLYNPSIYEKTYRRLPKKLRLKGKHLRILGNKVSDFVSRSSSSVEDSFIGQARIMSPSEAYSIISEDIRRLRTPQEITRPYFKKAETSSELQKKLYLDRALWMPFDILNKADKMTMAHSLELRVPYLDIKLLAVSQMLSDRLLVHGKHGKYLLRELARQYIGKESAYRKKKGFPVPFRDWIKAPKYKAILQDAFDSDSCRKFFDTKILNHLMDEHSAGIKNNARALYTVYAFVVWYETFFGKLRPKFLTLTAEQKDVTPMINHPEKAGEHNEG